jgi:hypothetical protein
MHAVEHFFTANLACAGAFWSRLNDITEMATAAFGSNRDDMAARRGNDFQCLQRGRLKAFRVLHGATRHAATIDDASRQFVHQRGDYWIPGLVGRWK